MNLIKKYGKKIGSKEFERIDIILIAFFLFLLYVSFIQTDILVTGNRSFLYYVDFFGFYENVAEWTQDYGANYLPSTFLIFALWNIPLVLFGRFPETVHENSFVNVMWYKLLPLLFCFFSAVLLYKIGKKIGFSIKKAKLMVLIFLTAPLVVFSQFIFSQYDIFVVFFMLLGFYFYLEKEMLKFSIFFGIAITFKYQALIYFLVLLFLEEKKFWRIIKNIIIVIIPVTIEILIYIDSSAFVESVLGFFALKYVDVGFQFGYISDINLLLALCAFLFVWAYVTQPCEEKERISWALFFCNGISFAFFGLISWHPQWFMIMMPFLVLSIMINKNYKMYFLSENVFIVSFYIYVVNYWIDNVDQTMLNQGIFKYLLCGKNFACSMADIYIYFDATVLVTVIWTILLSWWIFSHPKYQMEDFSVELKDVKGCIWSRFLICVIAFVVPAFICLIKTI